MTPDLPRSDRPGGRAADVRGAVRIDVHAVVRAEPARFVALAVDLPQLVELHPRLLDARWLDEPAAAVGTRAEITVALPAALKLLSAIVGQPRGVLTLVEHRPGLSVRYRLDADRVAGEVELVASRHARADDDAAAAGAGDAGDALVGQTIRVQGALWAKATLARAAMVPTLPLLEPAMTAAVRRTVVRADELLMA